MHTAVSDLLAAVRFVFRTVLMCASCADTDLESPTIEYATYWTMPANRFRLSSTMLDDEAELGLHRALPAPSLSAVTGMLTPISFLSLSLFSRLHASICLSLSLF